MRDLNCATRLDAGASERRKTIAAILAATLILAGCSAPTSGGNGTGGGGGGGTGAGGNPANPGPPQKVHLIWKQATNEWKVKLNGGNEQAPKDAHTKLDRNTAGPTMFEVDIQGGGSSPPTFKDGALSVWEGKDQKSSPKQGINSTQILGPVITKNGTLVFWDLNQGAGVTLNYQINFDNGVPPVDPIIDNGGHD